MSQYENWCLTAHEAVACGLPVLLPPQRWAFERFGKQAHYFKEVAFSRQNAEVLDQFYRASPNLPAPAIKLSSWHDVAAQFKEVYRRLLES